MTKVNFYIIESGDAQSLQQLACRLTEKALLQNNNIYIHTDSEQNARQLDEYLWSYRDNSFIPHALHTDETAQRIPVSIGHHHEEAQSPEHHHDVLINISGEIPSFFSRFERVAEVIAPDDASREQGRERFRFYRDRGYSLETHKLAL